MQKGILNKEQMKMRIVLYIAICLLLLSSCMDNDNVELLFKTSKIEISFSGDIDTLKTHFSMVTNSSDLYRQRGDSITFIPGCIYTSSPKDLFEENLVFYHRWNTDDRRPDIRFACSFFKLVKDDTPYLDTLNVHVKEIIDDKIVLDTLHIMRSYKRSEDISSDKYIFDLKL